MSTELQPRVDDAAQEEIVRLRNLVDLLTRERKADRRQIAELTELVERQAEDLRTARVRAA